MYHRSHAECQMDMNSVERIQEYSSIDSEKYKDPTFVSGGDISVEKGHKDGAYRDRLGEGAGDIHSSLPSLPTSTPNHSYTKLTTAADDDDDTGCANTDNTNIHTDIHTDHDASHNSNSLFVELVNATSPSTTTITSAATSPTTSNTSSYYSKSRSGYNPPGAWPTYGRVEYRNITVKYPSADKPALQGISFVLPSKRKVGGKVLCVFVCVLC